MPAIATVGKIKRREELAVEWTVPQFSKLSRKVDDCYDSPEFPFLGNSFCIEIFCDGDSPETKGYTALYLVVKQLRIPCTITFTLTLKGSREDCQEKSTVDIYETRAYGFSKFFNNSNDRCGMFYGDVLTICCSLKNETFDKASLLDRLLNVSRSMVDILNAKKRTDVVIKVEGKEIQAHRVILEAKSEVFQKMLSHDMLENRTGEIKIDDMKADVFQEVLTYMYGGLAELTSKNTSSLYVAADRFNLEELKALCLDFMKGNMSDDLFCDAYLVAQTYNEKDLMRILQGYIAHHSESIIETKEWKKFAAEDPVRSVQILTTFVKILAKKRNCNCSYRW